MKNEKTLPYPLLQRAPSCTINSLHFCLGPFIWVLFLLTDAKSQKELLRFIFFLTNQFPRRKKVYFSYSKPLARMDCWLWILVANLTLLCEWIIWTNSWSAFNYFTSCICIQVIEFKRETITKFATQDRLALEKAASPQTWQHPRESVHSDPGELKTNCSGFRRNRSYPRSYQEHVGPAAAAALRPEGTPLHWH